MRATVFRVTPAGAFTELVAFTGTNDTDAAAEGARPVGSLVERTEGAVTYLYGLLSESGSPSFGKVFRFPLPAGAAGTVTPQTVVRFTGPGGSFKGSRPRSGLTKATDGTLYGVTSQGGVYGYGTLYRITSAGSFASLYEWPADFTTAGGEPFTAPVLAADGWIYGATLRNGGSIYRISTAGTNPSVLITHSAGGPMGLSPVGLMQTSGGDLLGLSEQGGPRNLGVLFRLRGAGTSWTTAQILEFGQRSTSLEGAFPVGGLVAEGGLYYGTTEKGGNELNAGNGYGTIFSMTPSGQRTTLVSFTSTGEVPGLWPRASLLPTGDGWLYGTTSGGGEGGKGTVFRYRPSTNTFQSMAWFSGPAASGGGAKGEEPNGALIGGGDGWMYGTTHYGGATGNGTVFRIPQAGGAVQTLAEFTGFSGATLGGLPMCGLTAEFPQSFQPATAFYGVTTVGASPTAAPSSASPLAACSPPWCSSPAEPARILAENRGDNWCGRTIGFMAPRVRMACWAMAQCSNTSRRPAPAPCSSPWAGPAAPDGTDAIRSPASPWLRTACSMARRPAASTTRPTARFSVWRPMTG